MTTFHKAKIAVDLTPLRPGGENGGAKTLVVTLLRAFSILGADEFDYLLIAETWNHEELRSFQGSNMTCLLQSDIYCSTPTIKPNSESLTEDQESISVPTVHLKTRLKRNIKALTKQSFDQAMRVTRPWLSEDNSTLSSLKQWVKQRILQLPAGDQLLSPAQLPQQIEPQPIKAISILREQYGVDLLFCPFSSPHLAEEGLPLVAIAYDLQHLDLPFFFAPEERFHRTQFLRNLVDRAEKIICISNFTARSLVKHFQASEEQLIAIPICIHERLALRSEADVDETLVQLGLEKNQYLYFPANFWPHKNHRALLAAYSIYRQQYPETAVDLVFTGALESAQAELQEIVAHLGYEAHIHFLGFLNEPELVALWQGCRGLVFPSLYEGFGIPVLEAMWFNRPVACSNIGSLPEVGGDAVLYFDPRKPEEIAQAMAQIAHDNAFSISLQERAQLHIKNFSQQTMAEQYLSVFRNALGLAQPSLVSRL